MPDVDIGGLEDDICCSLLIERNLNQLSRLNAGFAAQDGHAEAIIVSFFWKLLKRLNQSSTGSLCRYIQHHLRDRNHLYMPTNC